MSAVQFSRPQKKFSELANFSPKQLEATARSDEYQYHLYGGARGPGKSYWIRWYSVRECINLAKAGIRQPIGAIFCEDYPSLKDRQIGKMTVEMPPWLGQVRETKAHGLGFHMHPAYGGGVIKLRNLDDPSKYQSSEFAFIGVDELTKNPVEKFNILRGSLRWPGVPKPKFFSGTNPGSVGHVWVKAYWVDRQFPPEMERIAHEFAFTRALPDDNPHLDQAYWEMLETLPPDLAQAWRWGSWDVFAGQVFKELRRDVHGFEGAPPDGWTFVCMDYGESAPAAVYWVRVDHQGELWFYRELYSAGYQYLPLKRKLREMSVGPDGKPEQIRYTVCSPDIFQTSKGTGVVGAEVFNSNKPEYGGFAWPVVPADNNRIEGWRALKLWISPPRIHVSTTACPNWWRTVPALVYDDINIEDVHRDAEDHSGEATRYGVMSRPVPALSDAEKIVKYSAEWFHQQRRKQDRRRR